MITIGLYDYDTVVRVRKGDKGIRIDLPASLCDPGAVGRRDMRRVIEAIAAAVGELQEEGA